MSVAAILSNLARFLVAYDLGQTLKLDPGSFINFTYPVMLDEVNFGNSSN